MKVIKASNKRHLLKQINEIECDHDRVYINLRPTKEIINAVVEQCSSLEKLYCPPSLLKQTAKKAMEHASEKNIMLEEGDFEVGRPRKYPEKTISMIVEERRNGKPAKQISNELDIPLRTVYFYLNEQSK